MADSAASGSRLTAPPRPPATAYVTLALLNVLSVGFVLRHWGEARVFGGSMLDQVLALATLLLLIAMVWLRSRSPLRHVIAALMLIDTLRDLWLHSTFFGDPSATVIGPMQLAVELLWLAGVAVLFFDRPALTTSAPVPRFSA